MINLFDKKFDDITYDDIKKLVDNKTHEGWTLEYKQQFLEPKKIAKSISSFANSEGGYYVVGIKESNDNKNLPKEIIGMSYKEFSNPYERIDNAVKDHISPLPYFETKVIDIPNTERYVLVVWVPEGINPPYLHHGSIYQRVGEITNPKTIGDRYILDYLFNKSKNNNKKMLNFFNNEITIMNNKDNPILELYFYNKRKHQIIDNFFDEGMVQNIKKIFDEEINILPTNDMDYIPANFEIKINQSYKSFIIKNCVDGCDVFCELFHTGDCKIILDIPCVYYSALNHDESVLFSSELKKIINYNSNSLDDFKFIEISSFYIVLTILVNKFFKFIDSLDDYSYDFLFKFKLYNCEESTLRFNLTNKCVDYYKEYGIPICYKNNIESDILSINETLLKTDGDKSKYSFAIYNDILMSLGLITFISRTLIAEQISKYYEND
ncbi:MAG: ATP-binding protein [Methanosphaera stadtmanae]|nr:ATP-binding protein [Methanosphaera stadtmanae]